MRITSILLSPKHIRNTKPKIPDGFLYRGKYRLVHPVTRGHVVIIKRELEMEDRNMFFLRHPFLKAREYMAGADPLKTLLDKHNEDRKKQYARCFIKNRDRTVEDNMIKPLMTNDAWE